MRGGGDGFVAALSLSDVSLALHASPVSAADDATASFAISSKYGLFPVCCSKLLQAGGYTCDAASHAVPAISAMRSQLLCEQLHPHEVITRTKGASGHWQCTDPVASGSFWGAKCNGHGPKCFCAIAILPRVRNALPMGQQIRR